jgi:hypothetical protein
MWFSYCVDRNFKKKLINILPNIQKNHKNDLKYSNKNGLPSAPHPNYQSILHQLIQIQNEKMQYFP